MKGIKLFVVQGEQDAGKTTAAWKILNGLHEDIDHYDYFHLCTNQEVQWHDNHTCMVLKSKSHVVCDFIAVVTLKIGAKVAIISAGDVWCQLRADILLAIRLYAKYIVCFARTREKEHSTMKMLREEFLEPNEKSLCTIEKDGKKVSEQSVENAVSVVLDAIGKI